MKSLKKKETAADPEMEHFGLANQLLPWPRCVDCSGIVWQGNKWFSVTEPFSHGDHQQLALSFTSGCPVPVAVIHSHMVPVNMSTTPLLRIELVLCYR